MAGVSEIAAKKTHQEPAIVALKRAVDRQLEEPTQPMDTSSERSGEWRDRPDATKMQASSGAGYRSATDTLSRPTQPIMQQTSSRGSVAAGTAARPWSLHVANRTGGRYFRLENVACKCE